MRGAVERAIIEYVIIAIIGIIIIILILQLITPYKILSDLGNLLKDMLAFPGNKFL
ncbi:MAG: hypothetical protein QXL76_00160 [Candidatus Rehaiarchaeum fermentans]|nr:hypothetical protein [Candidatus Rehaiarchaeum fermentans]